MLFFSESTQGYYDLSFAKYKLPNDAVEITKSVYGELREITAQGKRVVYNQGSFIAEDFQVTPEQAEQSEKLWVVSELERAGFELDKVQDSDPKAVGSVSAWRSYRKSLRSWVDDINFPNKEFRPVSPDA